MIVLSIDSEKIYWIIFSNSGIDNNDAIIIAANSLLVHLFYIFFNFFRTFDFLAFAKPYVIFSCAATFRNGRFHM